MAFHFQPQADSSDDEQVDLTAWQTGSRSKPPPAPVATMDGAAEEEDTDVIHVSARTTNGDAAFANRSNREDGGEDEEEAIEIPDVPDLPEENGVAITDNDTDTERGATPREQSESRKCKRQQPADAFISPSFTTINKRASPASSEEELSRLAERKNRRSTRSAGKKGRYVPVIPRVDLDELGDVILDFTAGRNVVRMVKKEITSEDGDITYKVELVDRHVEEVRMELRLFGLDASLVSCDFIVQLCLARERFPSHVTTACSPSSTLFDGIFAW